MQLKRFIVHEDDARHNELEPTVQDMTRLIIRHNTDDEILEGAEKLVWAIGAIMIAI